MKKQMGFYFDQTRCIGCCTCTVACKDWHDIPAGPSSWIRVKTMEKGKFPNVFTCFLAIPCYHCANPSCLKVCPTQAISKRETDGIVVVDQKRCLGKKCHLCLLACPYGAPQFRAENDARMEKCDLCSDRLDEGKKPICVGACQTRALDVGPLEELQVTYKKNMDAEGFTYHPILRPSIIHRRKTEQHPRYAFSK